MDLDAAVVADEAQLSKSVHEEAHAGSGRPNHFRKRLLTDFGNYRFWHPFLAEVRQKQEQTGKTLLTRIEQLIDKVRLDADAPTEEMRNEQFGECRLLMKHLNNSRLFQSDDDGVRHGHDRRDALRLPSKTALAEEVIRTKNCDDRFFALLGNDGELRLALLDVEDRIGRVSLGKDDLAFAVLADAPAFTHTGEKRFCIE